MHTGKFFPTCPPADGGSTDSVHDFTQNRLAVAAAAIHGESTPETPWPRLLIAIILTNTGRNCPCGLLPGQRDNGLYFS